MSLPTTRPFFFVCARGWAILLAFSLTSSLRATPPSSVPGHAPSGTAHVYKKVGDQELNLYVANPPGWTKNDKRPAIVWFHGGGWIEGKPTQFNGQGHYLTTRGMVSIQVDYRLVDPKSKEPPTVCVEDAKSAMRWVRAHADELGIDPNRIAAGGASAGGHLAAACALLPGLNEPGEDLTVSCRPDALVLFNPVFDNGPMGGYGSERIGDRYPEFSPAHNITPKAPPTLVQIGDQDKLVPVATVNRFQDAMKKAGVRCDVIFYKGQGHGFFGLQKGGPQTYYDTVLQADKFLSSLGYLSGPPTLKMPAGKGSAGKSGDEQ